MTDPTNAENARASGNEQRLTETQGVVVALINRLLSTPVEDVDAAVDDGLAKIGEFAGRDRAYVFTIEGETGSNSHEWCAPGTEPMIDHLQDLPVEAFEWMLAPIREGGSFHVPDIADFKPGSEEHTFLSEQGIRSILVVPMIDEGNLVGFVGFDGTRNTGNFLPGEIYLLKSFADVVRSVLMRRRTTLEMRQAQDELARERAFLQGIVSTNAAGFVVFSAGGQIVYVNDEAERVLGLTADEMLGRDYNSPYWKLTDLEGRPIQEANEPFVIVRKTGNMVQNHRIALHCPDGIRYASVNAAPVGEGSAQGMAVVYSVTDVTGLVKAEQAREFALNEAHRANVAKSNFLAKMSHEIRTPLNGILGISDILRDALEDPAQVKMLDILSDSGELLMGIINDLLDMSKIEADSLELEEAPFMLADLARRVEEVHTLRASEKQLSFAVDIDDPSGGPRLGDVHRLKQILHNMISNAMKFTEHGHVTVKVVAHDDDVSLTVSDSGIGMTDAQRARMFDPFAQADSTISRRFGGTGLGMSIVRNLVELMNGTIEVSTSLGSGTTVSVNLPLRRVSAAETPAAAPPSPAASAVSGHDLPELSILAADDNRTNQMILGLMLGQLGARVTLANDGLDALEKSRSGSFDLMIIDISMPGMDGVTLLSAIRADEARKGLVRTPAFAFTANAMSHQVSAYLDAGFDACLTKPLKLEKLQETLQEHFVPGPVG